MCADQSDKDKTMPQTTDGARQTQAVTSSHDEVDAFLSKVRTMPKSSANAGRLIFAMDATMSRQPTWDRAMQLQGEMFSAVDQADNLAVQLLYFRGFGECRASKWVDNPQGLLKLMTSVQCMGGYTQIGKVLAHIKREAKKQTVSAVVYIGDAMEEDVDSLYAQAGEVGMLGVPMFMFQERYDRSTEIAFREIARLTKGAWCRFDNSSASQLRDLLAAVAVYASGGRQALEDYATSKSGDVTALLEQLR